MRLHVPEAPRRTRTEYSARARDSLSHGGVNRRHVWETQNPLTVDVWQAPCAEERHDARSYVNFTTQGRCELGVDGLFLVNSALISNSAPRATAANRCHTAGHCTSTYYLPYAGTRHCIRVNGLPASLTGTIEVAWVSSSLVARQCQHLSQWISKLLLL